MSRIKALAPKASGVLVAIFIGISSLVMGSATASADINLDGSVWGPNGGAQGSISINYEENGIADSLDAHELRNLLPAPRARGRQSSVDTNTPPLSARVPLLSSILEGVVKQIKSVNSGVEPLLQSHSLGFDGSNKGRHFVRMLFDHPDLTFKDATGSEVKLALTLDTDFSGDAKDFGQVRATFGLFRQICSNGMAVQWSDADRAAMCAQYVQAELGRLGFGPSYTSDGAKKVRQDAEATFYAIFDSGGLKVPVAVANANLDTVTFTLGLKYFLEQQGQLQKLLDQLKTPLPAAQSDEDFCQAARQAAIKTGLRSPELLKFFIVEWLTGQMASAQNFKTVGNVVNFLTFLARSYPPEVIVDVERKAQTFALNLRDFLEDPREALAPLAPSYRAQIQQRLLRIEMGDQAAAA
jgi:hypothetical protein